MKSNLEPYIIPRNSLDQYISDYESISTDLNYYTLLKYARRSESEIAELAMAVGCQFVREIVTLEPRRLSFYATIVTLQTEIKLRDEEDLKYVVQNTYSKIIVPLMKSKINSTGQTLEERLIEEIDTSISLNIDRVYEIFKASLSNDKFDLQKDINDQDKVYFQAISEFYHKIHKRIKDGQYIPQNADETDLLIKKVAFDNIYNKTMSQKVSEIVSKSIEQVITKKLIRYPNKGDRLDGNALEKLTVNQGANRHTFMITGAPACGKSTLIGIALIQAKRLGIEDSDLVKINMDSYRDLVASPKELGQNTLLHSAYNADEGYLITQLVYDKLKSKIINDGQAPHILIDTVYPRTDRIDLSLYNDGQLHISCVTIPTELALKRAFERGKTTGRYVDSPFLLNAHANISRDFHSTMRAYHGKHIDYLIVDNNVARGQQPIIFEQGNLHERKAEVHDVACLRNFLNKAFSTCTSNVPPRKSSIRESLTSIQDDDIITKYSQDFRNQSFDVVIHDKYATLGERNLTEPPTRTSNKYYRNEENIHRRRNSTNHANQR